MPINNDLENLGLIEKLESFYLSQIRNSLGIISEVKNEEMKPSLKLNLLDNEENLFDLGLYVGLGGTVLSLILLLVLDVKEDALIGAYTSTLFGILFVAALKIFVVRPYRNHLLVKQADEKRYEP